MRFGHALHIPGERGGLIDNAAVPEVHGSCFARVRWARGMAGSYSGSWTRTARTSAVARSVKQAIVDEASDGLAAYGRLFSDACDACTRIGKKVPPP